ncbi:MAG: RNA polymerase sigma factor [Planctomycetota bacterium]|jgi:RNA polymerase sigma-70 factor (ECF subfamily)
MGEAGKTSDLVLLAREGDRDAFASLVEMHQESVYAFTLGKTADPERAQEITQDAFITAFTTIGRLEKPGSFRSWVMGIAQNLSRRRKKEIANLDLLEGEKSKAGEGLEDLAKREKLEAVQKALAELPENYRTALTLHYFDKTRGRAIGQELGVSEGAVHMILLRARKALAQKLQAFAPDE